jgi:hypothetical protein
MTIEGVTDADILVASVELASVEQVLCPTLEPGELLVIENR